MAELKIICDRPDSVKQLLEEALAKRLQNLENGIRIGEERLRKFEAKYEMSTEEFLRRFENGEITHRLDMEFDEWIGESRMLKRLREKADSYKGVHLVN